MSPDGTNSLQIKVPNMKTNEQTQVNYGIIGCGMMGREHIRNIKLLPNTNIIAIFEPDAEMREAAKKLVPDVQFYASLEALLAVKALDCLVIVSPNFRHVEQLAQIAKTRPLPILVEKPLSVRINDYAFIQELQKTYPCPIWVAMEYRYMPPVAKFVEQAPQSTDGIKMLSIREHRFPFLEKIGDWNRFNRNTGGTLVEKCCHFFDLMRFTLKSEPVRIMASGGQVNNHTDETYGGETPDIWDAAYVIVDFENGARAMLELCMFAEGAQYQEEISAVGPSGKIECFVPGPGRFWPEHLGDAPTPKIVISPRSPMGPNEVEIPVDPKLLDAGDHNGSTFYQHEKFNEVVRTGSTPDVTLNDGWMAVAMGLAAQKSAETGQVVEMAKFK